MSKLPDPRPHAQVVTGNPYWAALDLGSNSFHLLIAVQQGRTFTVVERLKEKVQLLGGFSDGCIQEAAYLRGIACIRRFAQRIHAVDRSRVRAIGTFALREARNSTQFVASVSELLGVPLEVISGEHEAQMVYQAVRWTEPRAAAAQVVIDIGGGSTELAVSAGPASARYSAALGCVAYKDRFFPAGGSQAEGYQRAKQAAAATLTALGAQLPDPSRVFGTSGTIESVQTVLRANGWAWDHITLQGLRNIETDIVGERWLVDAGLPGLSPDRVDIFPAGAAILQACFEVLGIEEMKFVDVSLLHGILYEAFGDPNMTDASTRSSGDPVSLEQATQHPVNNDPENTGAELADPDTAQPEAADAQSLAALSLAHLAQRFAIDAAHAARVERTALTLFDLCQAWWPSGTADARRLLRWAAQVHEIGAHINARHYHRHGAYILKHADVSGMSEQDRSVVALLVRGHRRSLPGLAFRAFEPEQSLSLFRLMALLRIAAILERSHADEHSPQVQARVHGRVLELKLQASWLLEHPLAAKELDVEIGQLAQQGGELSIELLVQSIS